ncbi:gliding-associated putative ABC transporter substrate-binding component GldG [uncultured Ruminococcus sp.]|nr:gliding-associated putative ABC transporter substrate-binding component GldG [uncultured Clostridium sp.]SCH95618.1 gliding-associated putative ABC transporter substrate-binding component GldG [uncultured Ruminococcus sp.]
MKKLKILNSRRFKHGSMATILTVGFIALVIVINVIANLLLARFPVNIDLTEDNIYQLTQESIDYAKNVKTDVDIYVCADHSTLESIASSTVYYKQAMEIIEAYEKQNSHINVEYVNLLEEPEFANEYAGYNVSEYSIIVKSDKRVKVIASLTDLLDQQYDSQGNTKISSKAEQVMTSALMYVTDEEVLKASLLTGHSETDISGFTSLLNSNNYEVTEQNITTEELDPEASMAVIYAPTTDYTNEELKKLDAFLDNDGKFGKTLIYIASVNQPDLPNLEEFLGEWGIEIGDGLAYETNTKNVYGQQGYIMGLDYTDTDYTADLRQPDLPFLSYYTRPLSAKWEEYSNATTKVLLSTPETSIVVPLNPDEDFDVNSQPQESHPVAILGQRTRYEGTDPTSSNVLVFGGDTMFNAQVLASANYNNNEYTVNLVNKLMGKEDSLNIVSVSFDQEALSITQSQYMTFSIVFMFALPIVCVIVGIVIWVVRRHK